MTINATVLGIFGVLGGSIERVWKGVGHISKKRKTRRESNGISTNFIYEVVKSHSRWIKKEKNYIMYRELKVRANVSGIFEM